MLLPLYCWLNTNLFPDCLKSIGYFASAVNVVSSNSCVGSSPGIKISYPLLSICIDELNHPKDNDIFSIASICK